MTSKQKTLLIGGISVLIAGGALAAGPLLENYFGREEQNSMNHGNHQTTPSSDSSLVQADGAEYKMYNAMTGDDFDKAFLADMIVHHQGAVEMADLALKHSNRAEIKELSQEIIKAQAKEITDMERWQKAWGYGGTEPHDHSSMNHGDNSMDMSSHIDMMMGELRGKTGDKFDKAWLEQMIIHHQGALNMAAPGEKNAKHQELKGLSKEVVTAQSKEIRQMRTWQKEWGY